MSYIQNKIKFILLGTLIAVSGSVYAKNFSAEINFGYATFSMNGLRDLNTVLINQQAYTPKLTNDFPGRLNFAFNAMYITENDLAFGLVFARTTTGSRIAYADYSGAYRFDQQARSNSLGVIVDQKVYQTGPVTYDVYAEGGIIFSKLYTTMYRYLQNADSITVKNQYKGRPLYVQPGVKIEYHYKKYLKAGLNIGYLLESKAKYRTYDNALFRYPDQSDPIKTGWSGLRVGVTVGVVIDERYVFKYLKNLKFW